MISSGQGVSRVVRVSAGWSGDQQGGQVISRVVR